MTTIKSAMLAKDTARFGGQQVASKLLFTMPAVHSHCQPENSELLQMHSQLYPCCNSQLGFTAFKHNRNTAL